MGSHGAGVGRHSLALERERTSLKHPLFKGNQTFWVAWRFIWVSVKRVFWSITDRNVSEVSYLNHQQQQKKQT